MRKYSTLFEFVTYALILGLGILLQSQILVTGDITWLMHVGAKFLAGGRYYTDFFEVNPPMCIYIYLIPILASQLLHLSFTTTVLFYTFFISIGSWLFCYLLLKKILINSHNFYRITFAMALAFVYFILPANAFGQREYLFVVLIMPFLLMAVLRAKNQPVHNGLAILAGVLAGIGIAQKPFFLLTWFFIELYLFIRSYNFCSWLRAECLSIISVLAIYAFSIFAFMPEYVTKIIPIINIFYYVNYQFPLIILLSKPLAILSLCLLIAFGFFYKETQQKELAIVLQLAVIGGFIIYLGQFTLWFYHMFPLAAFTVLLGIGLANEYWQQYNLFVLKKINWSFFKILIVNILLALIIMFTIVFSVYIYSINFQQLHEFKRNPVFQLAKNNPGKSIFIFTENISSNYPLLDYSNTTSPSRFPCLWLLTSASKLAGFAKDPAILQAVKDTQNFVVKATVDDLIKNPPDFIFVQQHDAYYVVHKNGALSYSFTVLDKHQAINHFNLFLGNSQFKQLWRNYRFVGEMGDFTVYRKIE